MTTINQNQHPPQLLSQQDLPHDTLASFLTESSSQEDTRGEDDARGEEEVHDESKIPEPKYDSYQCHNPLCQAEGFYESLHLYEFDDDQTLDNRIICQQCYEEGYRLCLITHEILHESLLIQIFDQIYVGSDCVVNLEDLHNLTSPEQIEEHLKMIGIDHPCPKHTIIEGEDTLN